jgi:hypothetical protein
VASACCGGARRSLTAMQVVRGFTSPVHRQKANHELSTARTERETHQGRGFGFNGDLNWGGSNAVAVVEIAIESALQHLDADQQPAAIDVLPDDLAPKITVHYYLDVRDALLKALAI